MNRTKHYQSLWTWLLDLNQYDRHPVLYEAEQTVLDAFVGRSARSRWQNEIEDVLPRLVLPVRDALSRVQTHAVTRTRVLRLVLTEMQRRRTCFWTWQETDWMQIFEVARQPPYKILQPTVAVAYLLQGFAACHRVHFLQAVSIAHDVFGMSAFAQALNEVSAVLRAQHYSAFCASQSYLPLVLAFALLARRSPFLHDLDEALLKRLYAEALSHNHQSAFSRLSYALFTLGIAAQPVDTVNRKPTQPSSLAEGVDAEWALWCQRWLATSTLIPEVRKAHYRKLMQVGRWLNSAHPEIRSPGAWTRELAAEFVAQVATLTTGEWTHRRRKLSSGGKPLAPRTKNMLLGVVRTFFRDCQRWEWIPARFAPERDLTTPSAILRLVGPDPRTLEEATWAKLLWAGLNFTLEDLPGGKSRTGAARVYPLAMIRAVALTWLFSGSRVNEICRLRVGCVRWQNADNGAGEAVCLLEIPVNKTGSAFWRPVDPAVGQAIEAWEAVRPPAGLLPDPKTGERVALLFSCRDVPLGHGYLNETLIPLLCAKAGVPPTDARGAVTSHRARATIATQLYAARNGMTLTELQAWLGHRTPESTRSYVAVTAAQQARAYHDADYLGRNVRRIDVLLDQDAVRNGAAAQGVPWRYFDLGHGYCQYDLFDTCAHRMACARCNFYLPKASSHAQLLEGKANLQRMAQTIPLTEEERAAVEDGMVHFERLCSRLAQVPTPDGQLPQEGTP